MSESHAEANPTPADKLARKPDDPAIVLLREEIQLLRREKTALLTEQDALQEAARNLLDTIYSGLPTEGYCDDLEAALPTPKQQEEKV